MADVVRSLGRGGQRFAERCIGWNRKTVRKALHERESGQPIEDCFQDRGRKRVEEHLPLLLRHIGEIVEPNSQADPTLRSTRIYTPLTAQEVRHRLRTQFGYSDAELPCIRTLRTKLNAQGYVSAPPTPFFRPSSIAAKVVRPTTKGARRWKRTIGSPM